MKLKELFLILITILFCAGLCNGQTENVKKAHDLAIEAVKLEDEQGKYDEAIELLKQAEELDPESYIYPYEIAYAFYLKKDYESSQKILINLIKRYSEDPEIYRLMGNNYDFLGEPDKAVEIYKEGLVKFPGEAKLYHELGICEMNRDNLETAIGYFEKGISVNPKYSSNYYNLSKIFCGTTEKIWGVLYGELFMHLEPGSKRTEEISGLLFDTYSEALDIETNSKHISFTSIQLFLLNPDNLPFESEFEFTYILSSLEQDKVTLKSLGKMRNLFIDIWYEKGKDKKYPNALFDWHKKAINSGFMKVYTYWLFNRGRTKEFAKWCSKHSAEFDKFVNWFWDNRIELNSDNYFLRTKYH